VTSVSPAQGAPARVLPSPSPDSASPAPRRLILATYECGGRHGGG
jgi:hypothetical protein